MTMKQHKFRHQAGLTLIEVLVSILIFSFGLLGFVGLQARAIQYSVSAEDTNRASLLANDIASQMMSQQTATPSTSSVSDWQARVSTPASGGLPNGVGTVTPDGTNTARITLEWQAPNAASGAQKNTYTTHVVVVPLTLTP
jgi:type IV pilus assembly protein PilV